MAPEEADQVHEMRWVKRNHPSLMQHVALSYFDVLTFVLYGILRINMELSLL